MKMTRVLKQLFVSAALVAGMGQAHAGTVTFSDLVDFENYSEAGMDMYSAEVWNWPDTGVAHIDGGEAGFVLNSGDVFNLNSIDLFEVDNAGTARFSAYLDGALLGFVDVASNTGTYNFGGLFQGIDEFRISVVDNHFSFDNVVFNEDGSEVPEPTSIALMGLGAAALLARRRKAA